MAQVRWDEAVAGERQERVSIWEIEPHISHPMVLPPDQLFMRANKRLRTDGVLVASHLNPFSEGKSAYAPTPLRGSIFLTASCQVQEP